MWRQRWFRPQTVTLWIHTSEIRSCMATPRSGSRRRRFRLQEQPTEQPVVQPRARRESCQADREGGYDCDFVQRPPKIQTDCSVCLLVLRSPHLTSCCGHNFCKGCIDRVRKDGKSCPLCSSQQFTLTYNRAHDISLTDFEVYCTYRKLGCEWKGKLEILEKHLNVDPEPEKQLEGCAFIEVQCCHSGCGQSLQRHLVANHQGEKCGKRPFSCDYCHDYNSTKDDVIFNHFPVCERYPVPCPNNCTPYAVERQHLERHLNEDCPLHEVECEFKFAGCQSKLPRKDMSEHLRENLGHITLLARQNQELTSKLLEKDEVQETMKEKLNQLGRTVEENQREIEDIGRLVEEQKKELKAKDKRIQNLAKEHQRDMKRLEREKNDQIKRLEEEIRHINDRVLAVEWRARTKAERVKPAYTVTAETEVEQRVRELTRKQDVTKMEIENRVGGLERQQDTAKTQLSNRMASLEKKQDATSNSLEKLCHHVHIAPVQITMTDFEQHKRDNDQWYSEGFYTHPQGYKMCLRVNASGVGSGEGTHISCFIYLMRGEFDNHLKWPFDSTVTIELLNQREDENHCTKTISYQNKAADPDTAQVTNGERAASGWGYCDFIAHIELGHNAATNCQYLMNDCLYFRVQKKELK